MKQKFSGRFRISETGGPKVTAGGFSKLINDNEQVFREFFKVPLFPGSLNISIDPPASDSLRNDLDNGKYAPQLVIPKEQLVGMPPYIGDGQAWRCNLLSDKLPKDIEAWIFRRIDSRVPHEVIEIVSPSRLVSTFGLRHEDPVLVELIEGAYS